MKKLLYWDWVKSEAKKINADGCSSIAADFRIDCCYEHDLGYYYGKSVRSAYLHYLQNSLEPWEDASKAKRPNIDRIFWVCNYQQSPFGKYSPMAAWRWLGVRVGGWRPWMKHRKER